MAISQLPVCSVSFNFTDERGANAQVQAYLPATTLVAEAVTRAQALAAALTALTGAALTSYSISYAFQETSPVAGAEDSRVEQKGVFTFRCANTQRTSIQIPAFPLNLTTVTGSIDEDLPLVAALVSEITDNGWTGSLGGDVVALERSYQIMRTTSRARKAKDSRPD